MIEIKIAKDFSDSPGGRYINEGPHSGEQFRDEILVPKFLKAKETNEKLKVDLDGTFGYATSFLDEAFGGLAEIYDKTEILDILIIKSDDQPGLIDVLTGYMKKR